MSETLQSVSPVSGQVVWSGRPSDGRDVQDAFAAADSEFHTWSRTSLEQRTQICRSYAQVLQEQRRELADLISREVGKLSWDADSEVAAAIAKVELSIAAVQQRRGNQIVGESRESLGADAAPVTIQRRLRSQPLGVVLVLGPFNFPLHLPGGQIIPALLAGNTVVFKPSEQATAVGEWMLEAWRRAGLPDGALQLIPGGVPTALAAIDDPRVAGVFLTGSREAGRAIHQRLAGRFQVVLALELGGNNPIVVLDDADSEQAAAVVSFSSFVSSGQRCTAARRVIFVDGESSTRQIESLLDRTRRLRVGMPGSDPSPHLGPLISARAATRLRQSYDELIELGCRPLIPFRADESVANVVLPAVLDASNLNQIASVAMGEMEWFGPLLVVQRADSLQDAIVRAGQTPYGLSASLLGGTREQFEWFARDVRCGVVNWNTSTTGAAGSMPFGGLGDSGNHRAAGFHAIDFCSDPVASIERDCLVQGDPWQVAQ
jgi:succinylglutamic semialdehyde dehydrogenase